jgi:hypothetical protein
MDKKNKIIKNLPEPNFLGIHNLIMNYDINNEIKKLNDVIIERKNKTYTRLYPPYTEKCSTLECNRNAVFVSNKELYCWKHHFNEKTKY